jgi:farnesyl-diphosphate farnesyltransferase
MDHDASDLLTSLLKDVSRSFYLTLRVLPSKVRKQISLAYLLARTSDTLADTEILPAAARLKALTEFGTRVAGERRDRVAFPEFIASQGNPAEAALLQRNEEAIELLERMEETDQRLVRDVLKVIISGQELDLRRFSGASGQKIAGLETEADLDDYTYRVAGVVGDFWTRLCRAHLFPNARLNETALIEKGVRFGRGLQLVNILRDVPKDLRQGRCYISLDLLRQAGLVPDDLLNPETHPRFRSVKHHLILRAGRLLEAGCEYTQTIPMSQMRVRLACAWPVLIGLETLQALRSKNVLDPEHRVKISRGRVKFLMLRSILAYPFPRWWKRQFRG